MRIRAVSGTGRVYEIMADVSHNLPEAEAFLKAFADDVILLNYARSALLSHSTLHPIGFDVEPGISRLFIVRAVDVIEDGLLRLWDDLPVFDNYFSEKNKHNPRERIEGLVGRFHGVGIEVNPEDIADFLALRYLRNIVVHGRLKPHESEYLQQRQMPTDPANFGLDLLERSVQIIHHLETHVAQAGLSSFSSFNVSAWNRLVSMSDTSTSLAVSTNTRAWVRHLLRPEGARQALWNPERSCPTRREDSYRAPRPRSPFAAPLGVDLGNLAGVPELLSGPLQPVRTALEDAQRAGWHPSGQLWDEDVPAAIGLALLSATIPQLTPISPEELLQTLRDGVKAYRYVPNNAPVDVFRRLLSLTRERQDELSAPADEASELFELSRNWYRFVEGARRGLAESHLGVR